MAEIRDQIKTSLKEAMKAKQKERRDTLRMLDSAFKQVEIDEQRELSAEDEAEILQKEIKRRREAMKELADGGRDVSAEETEIAVIEEFLPEQLSREEIEAMAKQAIEETGATEQKDMGKVMGKLVSQTKGRADNSLVSQVVRDLLNS